MRPPHQHFRVFNTPSRSEGPERFKGATENVVELRKSVEWNLFDYKAKGPLGFFCA